MLRECSECKYVFEYNTEKKENTKCPRCGKIYIEKRGCENCKGCSQSQLQLKPLLKGCYNQLLVKRQK